MSIFNSLGSNYNLSYVLKSFFSTGKGGSSGLKNFLEEKYEGQAILTYKGREALTLALQILNFPKDSEIAINGFTCVAVYNAIETAGYKPVCIDLDKKNSDLNFSTEYLEKAINTSKHLKAVVVQNTLGTPAEIEKIERICKEKNIVLIEDLAHCIGTKYTNGTEAGLVGDFVVLSFSQDKVIDAVSGGALIIRNKKLQNHNDKLTFKTPKNQLRDRLYSALTYKIRKFYDIGLGKPLHFFLKKLNLLSQPMQEDLYGYFSLPDWYANLALIEFKNLDKQLEHRRQIAKIYAENVDKKVIEKNITDKILLSSNLRFSIFIDNRKSLIKFLKNSKIFVSDIWYTDVAPDCPNAVETSKRILNLPTHINISEGDALRIAKEVNKWLALQ